MATTMNAAAPTTTARSERYRDAERRLWAHHGLEPVEHWVDLAEPRARIRVIEAGPSDGPPVVFVGGTGGTGPYWAPLVRELDGARALLVDRPGWGLSSPIDYRGRDYGATTAAILRGTLDELGLATVDVVGASVGNLWGLWLARYAPERVRRIALVGGSPDRRVAVPRFIRMLASPVGALMVRIPMSAKMLGGQLRAIGHGPALEAGRLEEFLAWRVAFGRDTDSMKHERAFVRSVLGPDGWRRGFVPSDADLAAISQPVRMIFGSDDPTGSVDIWRQFTSALPNGQLTVVDGAGHMPWWDDPASVGRAVRELVEGA
jgi:pimeloyl-ACP methyl ester carboxylesterase